MILPRPVKSVLTDGPVDAAVSRGWSRVQRKRRRRDNVRKGALAVSCLLLAASVGWAVRPYFGPSTAVPAKPAVVAAAPAPLDALVKELPKVQGRAPAVQRPVPPAAAAPAAQQHADIADPELDVVAALLESVRDAYDAGNTARAAALLQEIAEKHEEDPRAAQALYVLGLIQLDKTKDPKGAVESFTHALELQPPPELVPTLWEALERARVARGR